MTLEELKKKYGNSATETDKKPSSLEELKKKYSPSAQSSDLKTIISKTPETAYSLSTDNARNEKIAYKNPEKYAAAKELSDRLKNDAKFAAEYDAFTHETDKWKALLST